MPNNLPFGTFSSLLYHVAHVAIKITRRSRMRMQSFLFFPSSSSLWRSIRALLLKDKSKQARGFRRRILFSSIGVSLSRQEPWGQKSRRRTKSKGPKRRRSDGEILRERVLIDRKSFSISPVSCPRKSSRGANSRAEYFANESIANEPSGILSVCLSGRSFKTSVLQFLCRSFCAFKSALIISCVRN